MVVVIVFLLSIVGVFFFRRWSRKRQEATGEILPNFWISLGILVIPALLIYFIMGRPIGLESPELKGYPELNFKGGIYMRNSLIALTLGTCSVYGSLYCRNRTSRDHGDQQGPIRGCVCAGSTAKPNHELDHLATSVACYHSAADFKLLEPDQKLVFGDCGWIYGHHRHAGGHYAQPNGPRDGMFVDLDGDLSGNQFDHFDHHELVQRICKIEGALI